MRGLVGDMVIEYPRCNRKLNNDVEQVEPNHCPYVCDFLDSLRHTCGHFLFRLVFLRGDIEFDDFLLFQASAECAGKQLGSSDNDQDQPQRKHKAGQEADHAIGENALRHRPTRRWRTSIRMQQKHQTRVARARPPLTEKTAQSLPSEYGEREEAHCIESRLLHADVLSLLGHLRRKQGIDGVGELRFQMWFLVHVHQLKERPRGAVARTRRVPGSQPTATPWPAGST
jgi:hypothetical protein